MSRGTLGKAANCGVRLYRTREQTKIFPPPAEHAV